MIIGGIEFLCQKAQIRYSPCTESALFVLDCLSVKHFVQEGYCTDFLSIHDVGIALCVLDGSCSIREEQVYRSTPLIILELWNTSLFMCVY